MDTPPPGLRTGWASFDRAANHCETGYVGTGNALSPVQFSSLVRARCARDCNGFTFPEGHFQQPDLDCFRNLPPRVRQSVEARGGIGPDAASRFAFRIGFRDVPDPIAAGVAALQRRIADAPGLSPEE